MTTLPEILDTFDLTYTTVPGWTTRNSAGGMHPVGVMIHHTGSDNSALNTLVNGRTGLPGPLCHLYIEATPRDVVWVVCDIDANANHAGMGDAAVLAAVRNDLPQPNPQVDNDGGNEWFYGIEIEGDTPNDFIVNGAPTWRYWATVDATAALCAHHGWNPLTRVIAHKEWTRRKIDPAFDMDTFRAHVSERMNNDMADPRITDEEAAFLHDMRNATLSVNSNATFPQTIIPKYREWNQANLIPRIEALESDTSASGINYGDAVILQQPQ